MSQSRFVIPFDRLPEGFAETVDHIPEHPVEARPAATIVLLRPGASRGVEVLLLKRVRSSGFVPGAYVFPGGRVDSDDAGPAFSDLTIDLEPSVLSERLDLPVGGDPPAVAYYLAAVREAFEETGILVATDQDGNRPLSSADDPRLREAQEVLLQDESAFPGLLSRLDLRVDGGAIAYVAHWITPLAERRRYDTRFFAAQVPHRSPVRLNPGEMSHHLWLDPAEALQRHSDGQLPMVFPTIRTLEDLVGFDSPDEVITHFERRRIPAWLPKLVKTPTGIGLQIDD